jgi:hypothetical protein
VIHVAAFSHGKFMLKIKSHRSCTSLLTIAVVFCSVFEGSSCAFGQLVKKENAAKAASAEETTDADAAEAEDKDSDAGKAEVKVPRARRKGKEDKIVEEDNSPARPQYWASRSMEMRFGLSFSAGDNHCTNLHATLPFPMIWPEQEVELIGFEMPDFARYKLRPQKHGAGEIVIDMTKMSPNDVFDVVGTVRIKKSFIKPPEDVSQLKFPVNPQRNRELSNYLGDSPYIESKTRQIRQIATDIRNAEHENAWEHVEAIYDYVREKIQYQTGKIRSSTEALRDGTGDCEEMTSVFIAICRASNIPARCVWIPGHCYPEFYLEVDKEHGYWFPCQVAGDRQFGQMNEYRPILQKGDRFKTPESGEQVRYLATTFNCTVRSTGRTVSSEPSIREIQDLGPLTEELKGLKDGTEQTPSPGSPNGGGVPSGGNAESAATQVDSSEKSAGSNIDARQ